MNYRQKAVKSWLNKYTDELLKRFNDNPISSHIYTWDEVHDLSKSLSNILKKNNNEITDNDGSKFELKDIMILYQFGEYYKHSPISYYYIQYVTAEEQHNLFYDKYAKYKIRMETIYTKCDHCDSTNSKKIPVIDRAIKSSTSYMSCIDTMNLYKHRELTTTIFGSKEHMILLSIDEFHELFDMR
jgi:hypothetical protein